MGADYEQQLLDNDAEKKTAIENSNAAYDKTINDYQAEVDKQQQQLKTYEAEQKNFQQQQTDFAIDQIEQQQEQAKKDYTKEQQAAYGDYKRQTDPYGANAEQMAELGISQSGYSESSKVAMYTAYQNRVAAARVSMEQAKLTFDNAIREAKLTNDINLAKIAAETLEKSLALSMESIVYLGNLELEKAAAASSINQTYYNRAQDILAAQKENVGFVITDEGVKDTGNKTLSQVVLDNKSSELHMKDGKENAGYTDGGNTVEDDKADKEIKEILSEIYPTGVVTDPDVWDELAKVYGKEKLKEWGYWLTDGGRKTALQAGLNKNGKLTVR